MRRQRHLRGARRAAARAEKLNGQPARYLQVNLSGELPVSLYPQLFALRCRDWLDDEAMFESFAGHEPRHRPTEISDRDFRSKQALRQQRRNRVSDQTAAIAALLAFEALPFATLSKPLVDEGLSLIHI